MSAPVDVLAVMDRAVDAMNDAPQVPPFMSDELYKARAAVAELIERDQIRSMELEHCRAQYMRAIKVLSAIEMRCAPDDITLPDGRVKRFVPPDPEFYWRALSAKVKAVKDEVRALFDADDAAALARVRGGVL